MRSCPSSSCATLGAHPFLLPALLLRRPARSSSEQRERPDAGGGRDGHRARAARAVPRPERWITSPPCWISAAGRYYSEAAAQLIASLHAGSGDVQVVDVRNRRGDPGPARRRGRRGAGADRPIRRDASPARRPWRPRCSALVQHAKAYEMLAIEAAVTGDRVSRSGPCWRTRSCPTTRRPRPCSKRILDADAAHLPRFAACHGLRRRSVALPAAAHRAIGRCPIRRG